MTLRRYSISYAALHSFNAFNSSSFAVRSLCNLDVLALYLAFSSTSESTLLFSSWFYSLNRPTSCLRLFTSLRDSSNIYWLAVLFDYYLALEMEGCFDISLFLKGESMWLASASFIYFFVRILLLLNYSTFLVKIGTERSVFSLFDYLSLPLVWTFVSPFVWIVPCYLDSNSLLTLDV